jgi:hypothetical protein
MRSLSYSRFDLRLAGSALVLALALAAPGTAWAKPEGGKGKPERADNVRADGPARPDSRLESPGKGKANAPASAEVAGTENRGLEQVKARKAEQERKELGKGSEQGQAKRAENSRKWWKFWSDEKPAKTTPPAGTP